jgi:ABC-type bacteriocin/lantibiotic exporter with double-glycine peptidase domain
MQKDKFDRIISFLLGASWAIVIFGALITFKLFLFMGFSLALFITVIFIVVSFFMILALDSFAINRQRLDEAKKQTELLEKIYSGQTT